MLAFALSTLTLLTVAAPIPPGAKPSLDVVEVKLQSHSLADGLYSFFVTLKVADGWQVIANKPEAKDLDKSAAVVVEFLADGKPVGVHSTSYPVGEVRKDAEGNEYRAYCGAVHTTSLLVYDDFANATTMTVRVKVVATDGKLHLKPSILKAETR